MLINLLYFILCIPNLARMVNPNSITIWNNKIAASLWNICSVKWVRLQEWFTFSQCCRLTARYIRLRDGGTTDYWSKQTGGVSISCLGNQLKACVVSACLTLPSRCWQVKHWTCPSETSNWTTPLSVPKPMHPCRNSNKTKEGCTYEETAEYQNIVVFKTAFFFRDGSFCFSNQTSAQGRCETSEALTVPKTCLRSNSSSLECYSGGYARARHDTQKSRRIKA